MQVHHVGRSSVPVVSASTDPGGEGRAGKRWLASAALVMGAILAAPAYGATEPEEWEGRPLRECSILEDESNASTWGGALWPGGVVPYAFNANTNATQQAQMRAAMNEIEAACGVRFIVRTSEPAYLNIQDSTGNNSFVGRQGGAQTVNIFNWNVKFIMCHELLHALGEWHEQQRPDRDAYVIINTANIQSGYAGNFTIRSTALVEGVFDFDSVMMYDDCSFSTCCAAGSTCGCALSCVTIQAQPAYASMQGLMGQRSRLSTLDKAGLVSRYGSTCPIVTDDPDALTAPVTSTAEFSILATGPGTLTYEWRRNGAPLPDLPRYSGRTGPVLTITDLQSADAGSYTCRVSNPCVVTSAAASLVIGCPTLSCNLADITSVGGSGSALGLCGDGQLTVDDLIEFVNLFSSGNGCPSTPGQGACNRADIVSIGGGAGGEGELTVDDLIAFVNAYSLGCP